MKVGTTVFIHIEDDNVIQTDDIIAIIDYAIISSSVIMEEMLDSKQKIGDETLAKSVVITDDIIYLSSLSVATLKKRTSIISMVNKLDDYTDNIVLDNL